MTDVREVAELWARGDERLTREIVAPLAGAYGRGFVAAYDRGLRKASIRKDTRDADPTPGFDVPPTFDLQVGDYVEFRELGSDRIVLHPLDRDASTSWNPLTTPGQIIIAGSDGSPTVIEPPTNPDVACELQWDPVNHVAYWVPL